MQAEGTIDELNAGLGILRATLTQDDPLVTRLEALQHILFRLGADIATPMDTKVTVPRMEQRHILEIEALITKLEQTLPPQRCFILPSGSATAARLHFARTICRRAERWVVALGRQASVNPHARIFLNRLSDELFLRARCANAREGHAEEEVQYGH